MTANQYVEKDEYLPAPEDIRAACLEIQREWSRRERLAREIGNLRAAKRGERDTIRLREPWTVPEMKARHVA